jgi:hypothetical protein
MKIKLNADLRGHKRGEVIEITPFMSNEEKVYWQRRIYDAKYDKCCEIVTTTKEKPNKKEL